MLNTAMYLAMTKIFQGKTITEVKREYIIIIYYRVDSVVMNSMKNTAVLVVTYSILGRVGCEQVWVRSSSLKDKQGR